jgi:hypothetical protein
MPGFQKQFAELREAHFPAAVSTALFDHYYRFTVNTRIAASEAGKAICVGDPVVGAGLQPAHHGPPEGGPYVRAVP